MADQGGPEKAKGPRTGIRKTFLVITWIIIAGIAAQVTFIGLGLFYGGSFSEIHIGFGYAFGHLGALLLIFGFFGRLGQDMTILNAINFVLLAALPFIAGARTSNTIIAGLHPLVAFAVFGITLYTALKLPSIIKAGRAASLRAAPMAPPAPVVHGRLPQNR